MCDSNRWQNYLISSQNRYLHFIESLRGAIFEHLSILNNFEISHKKIPLKTTWIFAINLVLQKKNPKMEFLLIVEGIESEILWLIWRRCKSWYLKCCAITEKIDEEENVEKNPSKIPANIKISS